MIILAFVNRVISRLQNDLSGPDKPVLVLGPIAPPSGTQKRLVVSAGKMDMQSVFGDAPPGQVRPRERRESFSIDINNIQGPYTLSQEPLEGTLSCRLVWKQPGDNLEGKKTRVYPRKGNIGDGFSINYLAKTLRVFHAAPLSGTPTLEVEYSYPAIFTIREFNQVMVLESYAGTPDEAEKWAALATGILVSNTPALLEATNGSGNVHSNGNYLTEHLISQFHPVDGIMEQVGDNLFRYTVHFHTQGQVIMVRAMTEAANVIEKIYSPGKRTEDGPVTIDANLD